MIAFLQNDVCEGDVAMNCPQEKRPVVFVDRDLILACVASLCYSSAALSLEVCISHGPV